MYMVDPEQQTKAVFERTWMSEMIKQFVQILESIDDGDQGTCQCPAQQFRRLVDETILTCNHLS